MPSDEYDIPYNWDGVSESRNFGQSFRNGTLITPLHPRGIIRLLERKGVCPDLSLLNVPADHGVHEGRHVCTYCFQAWGNANDTTIKTHFEARKKHWFRLPDSEHASTQKHDWCRKREIEYQRYIKQEFGADELVRTHVMRTRECSRVGEPVYLCSVLMLSFRPNTSIQNGFGIFPR